VFIALTQFTQLGCSGEIEGSGTYLPGAGVPSAGVPGADVVAAGVPAATAEPSAPDANPSQASASGAATAGVPGATTTLVPNGDDDGGPAPLAGESTNDDDPTANSPPPDEPSASFVRRLTHVEYDNTIADLLGVDSQPSSSFEADLAQNGFTNNAAGQNVSPTLAEQYMLAAEALSEEATRDLPALLECDAVQQGEEVCARQFVRNFGAKAWRRPLTAEEEARMVDLFATARTDFEFEVSIQMVVRAFLLSPQFLYLLEPAPVDAAPGSVVALGPWEVATRLSYFLLGSMPDSVLADEAEAGRLDTPEAVAAQARRLLDLPRARERIGQFFIEWLRLRNLDRMQKDATLFPDYDLSWGGMMQEQVRLFVQSVILDEDGTAQDLLGAPYTFVNRQLAPLYGVPAPLGGEFERVELDSTQRAGILTQVGVLANLAHGNQTDPVLRGKFVRTGLLCDAVPPPPADAIINVPEISPGATTRERFTQHQTDPNCAGCHTLMDPIGLGFEHYDALGQWRDMDNGLPVDATGEIIGTDVAGTFDGALELSDKLADSEQAMNCLARSWLRFALGRSDLDADAGAIAVAGERFEASGFRIKELLVALTETRAFRHQVVPDPNATSLARQAPLAQETP
jgi:hypothetical protein